MEYKDFEYGYCSTYIYELQSRLGIEEYTLLDVKHFSLEDSIRLALSTMVGKEFIGKEGRQLIAGVVGLKNKKRTLITSISSINSYLEENDIPFEITEKRKMIGDKLVTVYEVIEIDC